MKAKLLIIDDEIDICNSLTFALEDKYNVQATTNPREGLALLLRERYNLVLLDLKIGKIDGINVLREIKNRDETIQVIIMTAYGSIVSSVDAIKKGAYTYLTKPLNLEELESAIEQALEDQRLNQVVPCLQEAGEQPRWAYGIIGKSPGMVQVFQLIEKLKDVDTGVVITGESGTGKELVARAIHFAGKRKGANFVDINCAAIPENLLEAELFGHKKGAFTGALADKTGKLAHAHQGTVFLDEIGDMSYALQAKLLRVLQQKEFTPIGSNTPVKIDVRIIAATNADLKKRVEEGSFRGDLYFRLNVMPIHLPPLRERRQDLPLLIRHFIAVYNQAFNKQVTGISREAENDLLHYHYPGNVRELINTIECAVLLSQKGVIEVENLPVELRQGSRGGAEDLDLSLGLGLGTESLVGLTLQEAEKRLISAALALNRGHRKATATMLGISERGLRNKINEYELNKGD